MSHQMPLQPLSASRAAEVTDNNRKPPGTSQSSAWKGVHAPPQASVTSASDRRRRESAPAHHRPAHASGCRAAAVRRSRSGCAACCTAGQTAAAARCSRAVHARPRFGASAPQAAPRNAPRSPGHAGAAASGLHRPTAMSFFDTNHKSQITNHNGERVKESTYQVH